MAMNLPRQPFKRVLLFLLLMNLLLRQMIAALLWRMCLSHYRNYLNIIVSNWAF